MIVLWVILGLVVVWGIADFQMKHARPAGAMSGRADDPVVSAAAEILLQGAIEDPKGGSYSSVSVVIPRATNGLDFELVTRGWVLDGGKSVILWNGQRYANFKLLPGNPSLEDDLKAGRLTMPPAGLSPFGAMEPEIDLASRTNQPIALCLLNLVGEHGRYVREDSGAVPSDRAEFLAKAITAARSVLMGKAAARRVAGDKVAALEFARNAAAFADLSEDHVVARRLSPSSHFGSWTATDLVVASTWPGVFKKELSEPDFSRPSADDLRAMTQKKRIAWLVANLNHVTGPVVEEEGAFLRRHDDLDDLLIGEGSAALGPLLGAIQSDERWTRRLLERSQFGPGRFKFMTVQEVAAESFSKITGMPKITLGDGSVAVAKFEDYFRKFGRLEPGAREIAVILDPASSAPLVESAAAKLVELVTRQVTVGQSALDVLEDSDNAGAAYSISNVERGQIVERLSALVDERLVGQDEHYASLNQAAILALLAYRIEPSGSRSVLERVFTAQTSPLLSTGDQPKNMYAVGKVGLVASALISAGGERVVERYVAYVRALDFSWNARDCIDLFAPVWQHKEVTRLRAEVLPLLRDPRSPYAIHKSARVSTGLSHSPLLLFSEVRAAVCEAINMDTPISKVADDRMTIGGSIASEFYSLLPQEARSDTTPDGQRAVLKRVLRDEKAFRRQFVDKKQYWFRLEEFYGSPEAVRWLKNP
jgi:hypothetical protein